MKLFGTALEVVLWIGRCSARTAADDWRIDYGAYNTVSDPDETGFPDNLEALYNFAAMLEEIKARIIVR